MKPIADAGHGVDSGSAAVARVLAAEREARADIERARLEVNRIAEAARADARSLAERTERRIRTVTGAFERALAARLAEIDAEAALLDTPVPLTPGELAMLQGAVHELARELIGAYP